MEWAIGVALAISVGWLVWNLMALLLMTGLRCHAVVPSGYWAGQRCERRVLHWGPHRIVTAYGGLRWRRRG